MTDTEVLAYDFFADDKDCSGIRNHTAKIVTTRAEHVCLFRPDLQHTIPKGARARVDRAIVDGEWKSFYSCVNCHEIEATEESLR